MARFSLSATVSGTRQGSPRVTSAGPLADVANAATIVADKATVAANVATLVADAATPTQAHVTTLNTNWGILTAEIAGPGTGDVVVSIDLANVTTMNQLKAAVAALLESLRGLNLLTA